MLSKVDRFIEAQSRIVRARCQWQCSTSTVCIYCVTCHVRAASEQLLDEAVSVEELSEFITEPAVASRRVAPGRARRSAPPFRTTRKFRVAGAVFAQPSFAQSFKYVHTCMCLQGRPGQCSGEVGMRTSLCANGAHYLRCYVI